MECSAIEPSCKDNVLVSTDQNGYGVGSATNVHLSGYRPADLVWLELSLVPEVERVFVDSKDGAYRVLTVTGPNSEEVRNRIYERELAVIESFPTIDFDFHILSHMDHPLAELVDQADRPAYTRR